MSANLSQVLPGWRGTDPDGGTWVMLARGLCAADGPYWVAKLITNALDDAEEA